MESLSVSSSVFFFHTTHSQPDLCENILFLFHPPCTMNIFTLEADSQLTLARPVSVPRTPLSLIHLPSQSSASVPMKNQIYLHHVPHKVMSIKIDQHNALASHGNTHKTRFCPHLIKVKIACIVGLIALQQSERPWPLSQCKHTIHSKKSTVGKHSTSWPVWACKHARTQASTAQLERALLDVLQTSQPAHEHEHSLANKHEGMIPHEDACT